jgi:hypothetical protein
MIWLDIRLRDEYWSYNISLGIEAVKVENRGSILRDFIAGKSSIAFEGFDLDTF